MGFALWTHFLLGLPLPSGDETLGSRDHLIRSQQEGLRNCEAEGLGVLEVDDELDSIPSQPTIHFSLACKDLARAARALRAGRHGQRDGPCGVAVRL